ncbi:MAG: hypothetical protein J5833_00615 [Victivallales bacterium]|nr:hypothetical protein [Victivallales bacterium]
MRTRKHLCAKIFRAFPIAAHGVEKLPHRNDLPVIAQRLDGAEGIDDVGGERKRDDPRLLLASARRDVLSALDAAVDAD